VTTISWAQLVDDILAAVETGSSATVFGATGSITRLPDELGGDPKQWQFIAAPAKSKEGFLALLQRKAHFLRLPQTIVATMKQSDRVSLSEEASEDPDALGETTEVMDPRGAQMRIPGASDGLAKTGYDLGRSNISMVSQYWMLSTIHHEMTHAWIWLHEFYDDAFQALWINGVAAFTLAQDVNGKHLAPDEAFTEAAAYVGDRILRWCKALQDVDVLIRDKLTDLEEIQMKLQWIVDAYDAVVPTYGTVDHVKVALPDLSTALRDAINKNVLDNGPRTKAFADTPLAVLGNALLNP